jgi:DNA polymerase V
MVKGGARKGAGRPKGQGKFGEKTKAIRVPESMVDKILKLINDKSYEIPLFSSKVPAGFPSPADDYIEEKLDLNKHLIKHPSATFFVRVTGQSMINAGIHDGDLLVVDRSLNPVHNKIVIAAIDEELTVKRLFKKNGVTKLLPENDKFDPIELKEGEEMTIWGVVTNVLHSV